MAILGGVETSTIHRPMHSAIMIFSLNAWELLWISLLAGMKTRMILPFMIFLPCIVSVYCTFCCFKINSLARDRHRFEQKWRTRFLRKSESPLHPIHECLLACADRHFGEVKYLLLLICACPHSEMVADSKAIWYGKRTDDQLSIVDSIKKRLLLHACAATLATLVNLESSERDFTLAVVRCC